jgi:hypothetical protein
MDFPSVNDIKKVLSQLPPEKLQEYMLRLAKYKKENKELLGFILFLEEDITQYVKDIKLEMDELFSVLNTGTTYFAAKGLRKILKLTNKYIKFTGSKEVEADLLIHFCKKMKKAPIKLQSSVVLTNLYQRQVDRVKRAVEALHEDIRVDYRADIAALES